MPQLCPELTTKLVSLKQLKQQFDLEFTKIKNSDSKKSNNLISIREAKIKLEQTLKELQNKLWLNTPELTKENLKAQYETQVDLLRKSNLLKTLSTGKLGIEAINHQEYPIPTLEQIEDKMFKNKEFLETKIPQGFVKLVLVPFGLPLDFLIKAYDNALMEHYQQGKLLDTKNKPLKLDKEIGDKFVYDSDSKYYVIAEASEGLVYFPQEFSDNHQGKTKKQLLPTQAWQVLLLEDLPDLPAEDKGKTIAGRAQPEANQAPKDYLKQLQTDPQYQGEQGLTPESWLVYALTHLTQTNQVIDDYQGSGKSCYLVNSYFNRADTVPFVFFYRGSALVQLVRDTPGDFSSSDSTRFAVSIF
ncbi:MAG: hypothetical protein WCW02_00780 [Candidatus Buchananbacteria bacterium]